MIDISESCKRLFRDRYVPREIRIHFLNGEMRDLTKKDIYGDGSSFSFTESLCSQSNLKFGLAEKSVIKFDVIDIPDIKGCTIEAFCEATDPDTAETVSIPYGRFVVASCQRQSNMRIRRVIAYSGAEIEISPLTMAKLSLPSLNDYSYRVDIDDLVGTGERARDRFEGQGTCTPSEFTGYTQGVDFDSMSLEATYKGDDGLVYSAYCTIEYRYKTVQMIPGCNGFNGAVGTVTSAPLWYDIRSEPPEGMETEAWDAGIKDILAYAAGLNELVEYQDSSSYIQSIEKFLHECDTYLANNTVRMEVLQTYKKKKLRTVKDVPVAMDDMGAGVRRSRYVSGAYLDVLDARSGTESGGTVLLFDKVADSTLTFMCPYSVEFRVECQRDDGNVTVFERSVLSGRKDILVGYSAMQKYHTMGHDRQPGESGTYQQVPLPYVQFEREEKADGYYWCTGFERNMKKAVSAIAEIQAKFVHMDRYGVSRLVDITGNFGMYPSETLYPSEDLYPSDHNGTVALYDYSDLWSEDYEVQPFGTVIVNYKNRNGNDEVLAYKFNRADRNVYHMNDNYIFKTGGWHPDEIRAVLDAWFVPGLSAIRYTPIELEMKGLPYVEAGDVLAVETADGEIETFVFRRTLKGINFMRDRIEAKGDEVNTADIDDSVTEIVEEN